MNKIKGLIKAAVKIHPMWPIEEKAIRGRIWDWFIPPTPPVTLDKAASDIRAVLK